MKEDLLKIISNYGTINQLKKLNEECYELIEAIFYYEWVCRSIKIKNVKRNGIVK